MTWTRPATADRYLYRDERRSAGRALVIFHRYDHTMAGGGAQLRCQAILNGFRGLLPTDVVSIDELRRSAGHVGRCPAAEALTVDTPEGPAPAPYRAEYCPHAAEILRSIIERGGYVMVLLSDIQIHSFASVVRAACQVPLVIDLHNAEAALYEEMTSHPDWHWAAHLSDRRGAWLPAMRQVERTLADMADVITVPSEADRGKVMRNGTGTPIVVVPNAVMMDHTPRPTTSSVPDKCVFIGALHYFPNAVAAMAIIGSIGAAVQAAVPALPVMVVGRNPPQFLLDAARRSPVRIVVGPDDIRPFFNNAVQIVPLTLGGGTRLKILEGFALGASVVSTAKGVEGIDAAPDTHYLAAEDATRFAERIQEIVAGPASDLCRRQRAWDLARQHYSWSSLAERCTRILDLTGVLYG